MKLHYILSLFLVCIIGLKAQVDPGTANLTHLWTFEDGTLNDQVGTAIGDFDGNNIYIQDGDLINEADPTSGIADSWVDLPGDEIDIGGTYTEVAVSAWFTPDTNNIQWNTLWFFGDDGGGTGFGSDGIALQPRRGDGHARFWFTAGASQGFSAEDGVNDTAYGNYNKNVLYHVVCEVNSDGLLKMYHDGVKVDTTLLTNNPMTGVQKNISDISPNFARLCHSTYSGDIPWLGHLHQISIYNKALSDDEVLFLYQQGYVTTGVKDGKNMPNEFSLAQNYPNPFNPVTTINFSLAKSGNTSLIVYDMLGRTVASLINGELSAGDHTISFNASNLPSGAYFYSLQSGSFRSVKKLMLMK